MELTVVLVLVIAFGAAIVVGYLYRAKIKAELATLETDLKSRISALEGKTSAPATVHVVTTAAPPA